jgi:hypothetical protein
VTTAAVARWLNSIIGVLSAFGIGRPSQSGQSGQPSPDSVARTTPPTATSAHDATAEATAAARKRGVVSVTAADSTRGDNGDADQY